MFIILCLRDMTCVALIFMKIVIPDDLGLLPKHYKTIKTLGNVALYCDLPSEKAYTDRIRHAEIITSGGMVITHRMMDEAKNLKYAIIEASGYHQSIDTKYATKRGIKVLSCPTFSSDAVANLTIAFILSLTRKIKEANESIKRGKWIKDVHQGIELEGKTLGLIGYGHIGKRVADIARRLGMKVKYSNSRTPLRVVDNIIKTSDILSLHLPLNEKTRHLMNAKRIRMMKKGAYFVNVSRGGLVDQKALVKALKSGYIAGAALDVFEDEPARELTKGVPRAIVGLAKMDNVIATPHIAYNTNEMRERVGEEIIANLKSCIKDKPINVVN